MIEAPREKPYGEEAVPDAGMNCLQSSIRRKVNKKHFALG
jgi:hypothetical protein